MRAERRAYNRHPVHWDAEVAGEGFAPLAFVITDFCAGGLFLQPATRGAAAGLRQHLQGTSTVRVQFQDPVSGQRRQLQARVVRSGGGGFGVSFREPQTEIVSALLTVAAGVRSAAADELYAKGATEPISAERRRENRSQLAQCEDLIRSYLDTHLREFFSRCGERLSATPPDRPHAESQGGSMGLSTFERECDSVITDLRETILHNWGRIGQYAIDPPAPQAESPQELSLVDEHVFEDWLAKSDVISRAETRLIRQLRLLQQRLSHLAGGPIDDYRNPLSPAALCHEVAARLDRLEPDHEVRQTVYPVLGQCLLEPLGSLYDQLNAHLRAAGILPNLEREGFKVRKQEPEKSADDGTADPDQGAGSVKETAGAGDGTPGSTRGAGIGRLYRSVRDLFRAQRHQQAGGDFSVDTGPPVPRDALARATEVLREAANTGEEDKPLAERLHRALQQAFPNETPRLNGEQTETVELLDQWFMELRPDQDEQPFFHYWSQRLKPIALQEELCNGAFLESRDHAVHRLVNALDRVAEVMAASPVEERTDLEHRLTPTLEAAVDDFDGRPETLTRAAGELEQALQRAQRLLETGMERVRQTCEGSQRLELARQAVEEALHRSLGGKRLPDPVHRLLDRGWRNHLVLVELRQGTDNREWLRGLRAVDVLAAGIGSPDIPRRLPREPDRVLDYVRRQLLASNRPPRDVEDVLNALREWLERPAESTDMPASSRLPAPGTEPKLPDLPQEWLGQAKLMQLGDWLELRDDQGHRQQLRLAWVSRKRDRFVFVNRHGRKAAELTLEALARQLGERQASAETDYNAPVTERRWQDMLVKLNQQLVHSATHDSLTGLLNRRAFQRRIRACLERSSDNREHVLIHLGLDDFKVVNNTLGHHGGDRVIRQVAERLLEITGNHGVVGRLGGDEFGILLLRCDSDAGAEMAEVYRTDLRQTRFEVDGQTVRLSASIGVVPFSRRSHGIDDLLKDGDGSCFTAKENGGNRIHVYSPGDEELESLRRSMSQAARLDQALDAGLLMLRCQRIEPLQGKGSRPLYEVLISIRDEARESIDPAEFIPAAERFGRMPALDRWVIREAFQWAASNPGRLREVDGLSINLSGQTLNDVGFTDYLKSQFRETGVPPQKICLEVTETAAVANLAMAADLIREFKAMGCRFALDDFGTGLSSYSYLKNLPADYLKIDGEFIRDLEHESSDDAMVRSIHELSHHMGKLTIAEYVESDRVRERLVAIGMDFGQGYGIERPLPLDRLGLGELQATV